MEPRRVADQQQSWSEEILMSWLKKFWKPLTWLIAIALVIFVFTITPFADIIAILGNLSSLQIATLIVVNLGIIILFGLRWWLLLMFQGYRLSYLAIVRYRLAAFGVSYFTPGPQFGGEPLQIYYLRNNHQVPTSDALASLSLDKLLELLANFTFLVIGLVFIFAGGYLSADENPLLLLFISILAVLPWGYLCLLYFGKQPITRLSTALISQFPKRPKLGNFNRTVAEAETQISKLLESNTIGMLSLMLISGIVWVALVFEYWLALRFLGAALNLGDALVFVTAARLAFLTPLPGGLGSLEISQVLAASALGMGAELGASIGLIIRMRDITFGLAGLFWGGILTRRF